MAGTPFGLQTDDPEGRWLTDANRAVLTAASREIIVEHLSARELNDGAGPERPPHAILIETSGVEPSYDELPGMVLRPGFERMITPELRFVQSCAAGVEHLIPLIPAGVPLANASGVHANAIAETVLCAILSQAKMFDQRRDCQRIRRWQTLDCREIAGTTHCIVGVGHIGATIARLSKAFGMRTVGVARTARSLAHFDGVHPRAELARALRVADYLTIACPLTPSTRGMIGQAEFSQMRRNPYLLNIARGAIVDDQAMIKALADGQISGAFLDAFTAEPLPDDHELWTLPTVRISPHDSHASQFIGDNQIASFAANLRRLATGTNLQNLVDLELGY